MRFRKRFLYLFVCNDLSIFVFFAQYYPNVKTMNDGLLLALDLFISVILLIWLAFKLYKRYDTAKSLMLMYIMQKHGPNSIVTIDLLKDIVCKALEKEGIIVSDISMVHEMGNRFHAILTIGNETREMTVIADNRIFFIMLSLLTFLRYNDSYSLIAS